MEDHERSREIGISRVAGVLVAGAARPHGARAKRATPDGERCHGVDGALCRAHLLFWTEI